MTEWTTTKLLDWTVGYLDKAGVESARLRSEMLLSHILGVQRIMLYINSPVAADKLAFFKELVREAANHKPVEYIIGHTTFYSMTINVNADTLIPRPETEDVVQHAIDALRGRSADCRRVLDLCTGSGCIAAAIAKNVPDCSVVATDISVGAMAVAAGNFKLCKVDERVILLEGNMFEPLAGLEDGIFDLIVSNPPYIAAAEYEQLDKNVRDYEPATALLAGVDGLDFYRRIAAAGAEHLKADGVLVLEIGYQQGDAVTGLLNGVGKFADVKVHKDLTGNDRVIVAKMV